MALSSHVTVPAAFWLLGRAVVLTGCRSISCRSFTKAFSLMNIRPIFQWAVAVFGRDNTSQSVIDAELSFHLDNRDRGRQTGKPS